jgi:hypothetical protein
MTLAAEDRLLLATAHTRLSSQDLAVASEILSRTLDWEYFVEVSIRHAVSPLVHASLEQVMTADPESAARVPNAARDELRSLHEGSAIRNTRLFSVLGDIVRAFDELGVQTLGLKDVQLAVDVYPERALRPMGDVDVLIHHEDYERVAKAMAGLGFSPHPRPAAPFVLKYGSGRQFRRKSDETWVDVQWDVAEREWDPGAHRPFGPRAANLWRRAVPLRIDDFTLLAPCPEDMLLHLCLHLEGHEYCELVLFSDIAEFLRHYGESFDWQKFNEFTREADAAASVHHVLQLTTQLFGLALPRGTLDALAHPYFAAQLYGPIFGNLTSMHQALDDLDADTDPPSDVMTNFELVARRQTAQANALHLELDALAKGFVAAGATSLTFCGSPSRRVFPDPSLPPFEPIHAFILADESQLFWAALEDSAFVVDGTGNAAVKWLRTAQLRIDVSLSTDLQHAIADRAGATHANRAAALQSLTSGRRRHWAASQTCSVGLVVHALTVEDLITGLAVDLGRHSDQASALFLAFGCIDLPSSLTEQVDVSAVTRIATRFEVDGELRAGLDVLETLLGCDSWAARLRNVMPAAAARSPHTLEWARYGPEALSRSPELRPAFLWLLAFMSIPGASRKARYVGDSLRARDGRRSPLLSILSNTVRGFAATSAPKRARDLCYWVEIDA